MNPKALTDQQITDVRQKYTSGESTYDLAAKYHCHRQTIWGYVGDIKDRTFATWEVKAEAVSNRLKRNEKVNEIRERYRNGESTYDLAERYFCCRQTIWEYVKDIKDRRRISKRKLSPERIKQIREAKRLRTFTKEIAEQLQISRNCAYGYYRDFTYRRLG